MLLVVGAASSLAAIAKCGCEEPVKPKKCCTDCTCELKASNDHKHSPDLFWVPAELEVGLIPVYSRLEEPLKQVEKQQFVSAPIPQANSPPERVLGRAPPFSCS